MVDLPQMCGSILLKNVKKNPKDITLHNASIAQKFSHGQPQKLLSHLANHCLGCTHEIRKECLRQINDDNNNENLESSTTQQPISNFY